MSDEGAPRTAAARGRPSQQLDLPADAFEFASAVAARGWSDGLPVIPPTPERVTAMLGYSDRDPLEVLCVIPPRQGEATVQAVAISAVLAGCAPRHFPVVLAAVEALGDPGYNVAGINATTHPAAGFVLVNGPIARELGIHAGPGCFGPGFPANAAIGRALRFVLLNVGGATPGEGDRATQGTPAKYAFCAAEREDANPWGPFHTTRGFTPEVSTVTVFACEGPHNIQDHGSTSGLGVLQTVAGAMGQAGSNNLLARGQPLLALGPEHAATIAADGYSRADVQAYLFEHARYPARLLSTDFWEAVRVRALEVGDPSDVDAGTLLPIVNRPEDIHVIVAGGPGKHSSWMPTFGRTTRPSTVAITDRSGRAVASVEELRS